MKKINRVLLVDDDIATNYLHKTLLKGMNLVEHVELASNGKEALDYVSLCSLNDLPDLTLLDVNMPQMSGFEFLEKYLTLDEERQTGVKLLMITAAVDPKDRYKLEKYEDIVQLVNKPLTVKKVVEIWEKYFSE